MRVFGTCPKCGAVNQFEAQYDDGWQVQCITCGKILYDSGFDIEDNKLTKRYDISGSCISSSFNVSCLIHFNQTLGAALKRQFSIIN